MQEYRPQEIEIKWQKYWEEQGLLDFDFASEKPKFYMLTMLPYPSGDLHIGGYGLSLSGLPPLRFTSVSRFPNGGTPMARVAIDDVSPLISTSGRRLACLSLPDLPALSVSRRLPLVSHDPPVGKDGVPVEPNRPASV